MLRAVGKTNIIIFYFTNLCLRFAFGMERMMLAAHSQLLNEDNTNSKVVLVKITSEYESETENLNYLKFENKLRDWFNSFENYNTIGLSNTGASIPISSIRINRKKLGRELSTLEDRFTHAIIIGDDEVNSNELKIKNLSQKTELSFLIN